MLLLHQHYEGDTAYMSNDSSRLNDPNPGGTSSISSDASRAPPPGLGFPRPGLPPNIALANNYDQGMRRLLLLQTLAARQSALIQAHAASAPFYNPNALSSYPLPPPAIQTRLPPTPSSSFVTSPSSPHISHLAPTPPPTPNVHNVDPWEGIIGSLDQWPNGSSGGGSGDDSTPASWASLDEKDLQTAQEQLDAWTSQLLGSGVVPSLLPLVPSPPLAWPHSVAPSLLYPPPPPSSIPPPPAAVQRRRTSTEIEEEEERESRVLRARAAKGKAKGKEEVPMKSDDGSGDEDDKRRRNTEASGKISPFV